MKAELIKDLEALINEKDPDKIGQLKESITNSFSSDHKHIMQRVNMYTDNPGKDTQVGIESIIKELKEKQEEEKD
jgi:hypothetical protein